MFWKGAALQAASVIFNSSLDGGHKGWAIHFHEGEKIGRGVHCFGCQDEILTNPIKPEAI